MSDLGERLKQARTEAGVSLAGMALRTGFSRSYLGNVETGARWCSTVMLSRTRLEDPSTVDDALARALKPKRLWRTSARSPVRSPALTRSPCSERELRVFVVSVGKGQEVIETVTREIAEKGVTHGAIVSLIGAVEGCCISVMPKADALDDILTEYQQPFEISGTGEIKDGRVHVHVIAGGEDGTVSGHLHWARVDHWFVNAYVVPSP
jgi:predicted DNA-binding protein with PD1-like motif